MNLEISAWPSVASLVLGFLFVLSASLVVLAYLTSKQKPMAARRPKTNSSDKSPPVEAVAVPNADLLRQPGQVDRGWPAARDDGHQPPFWASWPVAPDGAAITAWTGSPLEGGQTKPPGFQRSARDSPGSVGSSFRKTATMVG